MPAPGLDLHYRPDLPALIARWQRNVSPTELQAGYDALRTLADEAPCHRWLLDLRRRDDLADLATTTWFGQIFLPSLRHRYQAPVRLAFLVSPLRAAEPIAIGDAPAPTDCVVANFTDEATAHRWLQEGA